MSTLLFQSLSWEMLAHFPNTPVHSRGNLPLRYNYFNLAMLLLTQKRIAVRMDSPLRLPFI
ncbi:MAG: hypothetical protein ACRCY4_07090 [Brevinema sp.]